MTKMPGLLYVPVLKGKEGEFGALETLAPHVRELIAPLIEVPGIPYDYVNERPARSLDQHVSGVAERLKRCWGEDRPLYLDLPWFEGDEHLTDGTVAIEAVLADCARLNLHAIPVISRASSSDYLAVVGHHASQYQSGVCVRLLVQDFSEDVDPDAEIERLRGEMGGVPLEQLDLVLDLEDLGPDAGRDVLVARSIFSMIPARDSWRRIILAAASFPEDLSDVDAATLTTLPRREWLLWETLQRRPGLLPRADLIFADYAIAHPMPKELDPRTMRMSASIRYSTPDSWLIVKGRNVRQFGFEQYFELSRALVARPEFCGGEFSWGDSYIQQCANRETGPGNATTWRKVGTNHHITLVAHQLST